MASFDLPSRESGRQRLNSKQGEYQLGNETLNITENGKINRSGSLFGYKLQTELITSPLIMGTSQNTSRGLF